VREYLVERGVDPARVPDAVLVLSELLTNALEASPVDGLVDIEVTAGPRAVRLDVTNRLTTAPPAVWPALAGVEMPPATAERGRGLPLVAALAARMAIDVSDDRTHVRADLIV
jgi:anti-sigma regulatory factor (Ser/Thr protein kinase)